MRLLPSYYIIPAGLLSFGLSTIVSAVTLPSRMPSFARTADTVDPGLDKWIKENIDLMPVSEMNSAQVLLWIGGKDPITRAYIALESRISAKLADKKIRPSQAQGSQTAAASDKELQALYKKTLEEVPQLIKSELGKDADSRHLLLPPLFLTWKSIDSDAAEKSGLETKVFSATAIASCAAKAKAIDDIDRSSLSKMSSENLISTVSLAGGYKSPAHRRRYLETLAMALPEARRAEVASAMRTLAKDFPGVVQRYSWLQDETATDLPQNLIFAESMRSVRRKHCHEAEKSFDKILAGSKTKIEASTAIEVGSDIDRCYRAEHRASPLEFWSRVKPKLESRFGKSGALWAQVRVGYLKWVGNDLATATKIYDEILAISKNTPELRSLEAKSIYTLGKISEDKNELDLAGKFFVDYINRFSDQEDFEFAINSLVVNFAAKKKWQEIISPLEKFLAQQSLQHIDRRPVGLMSFSLFWLGRAHLQLGNAELAQELWRRLAAEYYSTFYGAMGHYLLEQSSGTRFAIEPARTAGFDYQALEQHLNPLNRLASKRTSAFLQAGFPEKARCEAEEVVAGIPDDYDTLLARTLLLHASGGWLDAIKVYDSIPRSVRNGLPIGFERVLFPRKYAEIVKAKAAKLNVDPDFVFALMRQESVFAKDAMSPVGATGLMQLMPSTARVELNKLSDDYIDAAERAELDKILENESALRDPEVNVTLGVHHLWRLLKIYKSTVFALTAYNASPAATEKWQRTIATDDWLTFIERIPYKETRAYVKLILRNYFYYKRWYNSPDGKGQIHIDSVIDDLIALAKNPPQHSSK